MTRITEVIRNRADTTIQLGPKLAPAASPRDHATMVERSAALPPGQDERFAGYGVMGLPFGSGHYLALRRFAASSLGPAYSAVWWRDAAGRWAFFADAPARLSCARYFGPALERAEECEIGLAWRGPRSLSVSIPGILDWQVELGSSLATRLMSRLGGAAPRALWRSRAALGVMGRLGGPLLGVGRLRLQGSVPSGQRSEPVRAWPGWSPPAGRSSSARVRGPPAGSSARRG
jgi:hypothetical protein